MPGLRGTPAGMMTTSHPERASISCEAPEKARTYAGRRCHTSVGAAPARARAHLGASVDVADVSPDACGARNVVQVQRMDAAR